MEHKKLIAGVILLTLSATGFSAENIVLYYLKEVEMVNPIYLITLSSCSFFVFTVVTAIILRPSFSTLSENLTLTILTGFLSAVGHACFQLSNTMIGPGDATAILYTEPIFCTFLSFLILGQGLNWKDVFFAFCSTVAVVLISKPSFLIGQGVEENLPSGLVRLAGAILALGSAISVASSFVFTSKLGKGTTDTSWLLVSFSSQYFGLSAIICTFLGEMNTTSFRAVALVTLSGFILFVSVCLSIIALLVGVRPSYTSVILSSEVITSSLGQFLLFGFTLHWTFFVALSLTIFSCVGASLTQHHGSGDSDDDVNKGEAEKGSSHGDVTPLLLEDTAAGSAEVHKTKP